MRKLYLTNDKGASFRFDYASGVLISDMSGLGFEKSFTFTDYGNIYKGQSEVNGMTDISLSLVFLKGYKGYKVFLGFIENSAGFDLYYESDEVRYANCQIVSLSKAQLVAGTVQSELKIKKLSYWFRNVTKRIQITVSEAGKVYPYSFSYTYSESCKGTVSITNNGYAKAPLRIIINGAFDNPEIIVSRNGSEIMKMKICYTSANAKIEVDAFPTDQKIEITENGETVNGYEYQDFTCENFLFLEKGDVRHRVQAEHRHHRRHAQ
jgi:hypothetical protein